MPVKAAGILVDPPVSVPIVISDISRDIDTAPPDVDPPGTVSYTHLTLPTICSV